MELNSNLQSMINHAITTTPFYRDQAMSLGLFGLNNWTLEDFQKLPLITKQQIQEDHDYFLSEPYNEFPGNQNIDIVSTSGSTGKYLKIPWDNRDYNRSMIGIWMIRKSYYDILPEDKYCYFYVTERRRNRIIELREQAPIPGGRSLGFCKNNFTVERLRDIYLGMYEFDPKWVIIQPSIALLLAEYAMAEKLPPMRSLKYMEFTGELLTKQSRKIIESAFPVKTANLYGCMEVGGIAIDRGQAQLHCLPTNYIEIIKDGVPVPYGQEGEIYVTSLCNHAMPFIRYQTGDTGVLRKVESGENCYLELSYGRISQYIITKENHLPFDIILRPIELINEKSGNIIRQFRVTQNDIDDFSVEFALNTTDSENQNTISRLFVNYLREPSLSGANWSFTYHDMIYPDENSGKVSLFVQKTPEYTD